MACGQRQGLAPPPCESAMGVPGDVTAWGTTYQLWCPVPGPGAPPGTRRPYQVVRTIGWSCSALLCWSAGRRTPTRDDARTHQALPARGTALRMQGAPLRAYRLPIQDGGCLHRRLAQGHT